MSKPQCRNEHEQPILSVVCGACGRSTAYVLESRYLDAERLLRRLGLDAHQKTAKDSLEVMERLVHDAAAFLESKEEEK